MRAFLRFTWTEFLGLLREPTAFFFTLLFPALLLVMLGFLFAGDVGVPTPAGTFRLTDVMVPGNLSWVLANMGLMGVYPVLTSLRERKVLKWYRTHPIRAWHILASQYLAGLAMAAMSLALMAAVGKITFDLHFYGHVFLLLIATLVAYTAPWASPWPRSRPHLGPLPQWVRCSSSP